VTGLKLLFSFTYYLSNTGVGTQTETKALVIDVLTNNVVSSIVITSSMPTTSTVKVMTVSFSSTILINPLCTYVLAFCTSAADDTVVFGYASNTAVTAAVACVSTYAKCQATGANPWTLAGVYNLQTVINGSCPVPLPSLLPLCSPTTPLPSTLDSDTGAGAGFGPYFGAACISNRVTGLALLLSYTYHFTRAFLPTTNAKAIMFDAETNAVVRLVNITANMPGITDVAQTAMAATFATLVVLNPSHNYLLAVCVEDDLMVFFSFVGNDAAYSVQFCIGTNAECQAAGRANHWIGFPSTVTARTTIIALVTFMYAASDAADSIQACVGTYAECQAAGRLNWYLSGTTTSLKTHIFGGCPVLLPLPLPLCSPTASAPATLNSDTGAGNIFGPYYRYPCISNRVTGYALLFGYMYYFSIIGLPTTEAKAIVFDTVTNTVVSSVDITTLMLMTVTVTGVTASFASPVVLDPSHNYLLTVCIEHGAFNFAANNATDSFQVCVGTYAECQAAGGVDCWYASESAVSLWTSISGSCTLPSPSPLPTPLPLPSPLPLPLVLDVCGPNTPNAAALDENTFNLLGWGSPSAPCIGNRVRGLVQITSFTYYFCFSAGTLTEAMVLVINGLTNAVVSTVNVTALMPTNFQSTAVTATFASTLALDPLCNYLFAMCTMGSANLVYLYQYNLAVSAIAGCSGPYANCQAMGNGSLWIGGLSVSGVSLQTVIDGSCSLASPSPSSSPSTLPSPSPIPLLLVLDLCSPTAPSATIFTGGTVGGPKVKIFTFPQADKGCKSRHILFA
jgi:hypothetical protein